VLGYLNKPTRPALLQLHPLFLLIFGLDTKIIQSVGNLILLTTTTSVTMAAKSILTSILVKLLLPKISSFNLPKKPDLLTSIYTIFMLLLVVGMVFLFKMEKKLRLLGQKQIAFLELFIKIKVAKKLIL
jgi:hypothetical protein